VTTEKPNLGMEKEICKKKWGQRAQVYCIDGWKCRRQYKTEMDVGS